MTERQRSQAERRWSRPRWFELLPEFFLVAGLTLFLVDETDAATSAFKSERALAIMAVAGVAWVGARVVAARFIRWRLVRTVLFGIAAGGALLVVVAPAYDNSTVVETFPAAPTAAVTGDPAAATTTTIPTTSTTMITTTAPTGTPMAEPSGGPGPTITTTTLAAPAEPVRLRAAPITGIDHRAAGTASILRATDGRHVVGLETFDIQPGPDYDVYLVPGHARDDLAGSVRLDDLRGNRGTQYYEVPEDVDVGDGPWTVLIWCQTFGVPVAHATPL